jgi:type VI secretion system protein ImpF
MGRDEHVGDDVHIIPSVLDRLLDYEPGVRCDPDESDAESVRQYKQSLRRDLDWLLNTRRVIERIPPAHKELRYSLAAYGLPDFSAADLDHSAEGARRAIEAAIRVFEPRLSNVAVVLAAARDIERALVFRVEARLRVEPSAEPITFHATISLDNGACVVEGDD